MSHMRNPVLAVIATAVAVAFGFYVGVIASNLQRFGWLQ